MLNKWIFLSVKCETKWQMFAYAFKVDVIEDFCNGIVVTASHSIGIQYTFQWISEMFLMSPVWRNIFNEHWIFILDYWLLTTDIGQHNNLVRGFELLHWNCLIIPFVLFPSDHVPFGLFENLLSTERLFRIYNLIR